MNTDLFSSQNNSNPIPREKMEFESPIREYRSDVERYELLNTPQSGYSSIMPMQSPIPQSMFQTPVNTQYTESRDLSASALLRDPLIQSPAFRFPFFNTRLEHSPSALAVQSDYTQLFHPTSRGPPSDDGSVSDNEPGHGETNHNTITNVVSSITLRGIKSTASKRGSGRKKKSSGEVNISYDTNYSHTSAARNTGTNKENKKHHSSSKVDSNTASSSSSSSSIGGTLYESMYLTQAEIVQQLNSSQHKSRRHDHSLSSKHSGADILTHNSSQMSDGYHSEEETHKRQTISQRFEKKYAPSNINTQSSTISEKKILLNDEDVDLDLQTGLNTSGSNALDASGSPSEAVKILLSMPSSPYKSTIGFEQKRPFRTRSDTLVSDNRDIIEDANWPGATHPSLTTTGGLWPSQLPTITTCKCSRTRCLKLYCDCFKVGRLCTDSCACTDCKNKDPTDPDRREAMESTIVKNPVAFKPRVTDDPSSNSKGHLAGCNCRKSNCLKKYCECFNGGAACGKKCRCMDCKNKPELWTHRDKEGVRTPNTVSSSKGVMSGSSDNKKVASALFKSSAGKPSAGSRGEGLNKSFSSTVSSNNDSYISIYSVASDEMNVVESDLVLFDTHSANRSQESGPLQSGSNSHNNILSSQNTSTISLPIKSLIKYIQHDPSTDSKHSHHSSDFDVPAHPLSSNAQHINGVVKETDSILGRDGSSSNITIQITPIFSQMSQQSETSLSSLKNISFPSVTHDTVRASSPKASKRTTQALNLEVDSRTSSVDNSIRPTLSLASPQRSSVTAAGTALLTDINSPFSPHSYTTAHMEHGASPYRASYSTNNTLNTSNNSSIENYEDIRMANIEVDRNGYKKTAAAADATSPATPTHHVLAQNDCAMIESLLLSPEPKTKYYLASNGNNTQNYMNNSSNNINGCGHHYESSSDTSNPILPSSKRKSHASKLSLDLEIDTTDTAASASNTHHWTDHISHSVSIIQDNGSVASGSGSAREGLRSSGSMTSMNNGSNGDLDVLSQFAEVCEDRVAEETLMSMSPLRNRSKTVRHASAHKSVKPQNTQRAPLFENTENPSDSQTKTKRGAKSKKLS